MNTTKICSKKYWYVLEKKLWFLEHIDEKIKKATLEVNLNCTCLIRTHLGYEDVVNDQQNLSH